MKKLRIAILFHEKQEKPHKFVIHHLAQFWKEDGHEVQYLFGYDNYSPADILIVHVDLSVVPNAYLQFADQYPVVLNGKLKNICKSQISSNLLRPNDPWPGKVILKTDRNYFGLPEKVFSQTWLERKMPPLQRFRDFVENVKNMNSPMEKARAYTVFDSLNDIPPKWFTCGQVVIEKFLPEYEDGMYNLRIVQILGDKWKSTRLSSHNPVIKAHNSVKAEEISPHPLVKTWCHDFALDYGKIDYVICEDTAVLLDVNKTVGATSDYRGDNDLTASRRFLAYGLYDFVR